MFETDIYFIERASATTFLSPNDEQRLDVVP